MVNGPPVGRVPVPVPGATNGNPQSVQGIGGYPQRYLWSRSAPEGTPAGSGADRPLFYSKSVQIELFCTWAFLPPSAGSGDPDPNSAANFLLSFIRFSSKTFMYIKKEFKKFGLKI